MASAHPADPWSRKADGHRGQVEGSRSTKDQHAPRTTTTLRPSQPEHPDLSRAGCGKGSTALTGVCGSVRAESLLDGRSTPDLRLQRRNCALSSRPEAGFCDHGAVDDPALRGTVVIRSAGLNLIWCGLVGCLVPIAWLWVELFSFDRAWLWTSVAAAALLIAAILRRRVIVDDDRVVVQGAFWRREHLIRDIARVDLVDYDGFWAWNEWPWDYLLNPFSHLSSPQLTLRSAGEPDKSSEHELRALAGTNHGSGRRAGLLMRAIAAHGGHDSRRLSLIHI